MTTPDRPRSIPLLPPGGRLGPARKRALLRGLLSGMERTLVAYSGGVDSAFLLAEAFGVLGERALGVIAKSPSLPGSELHAALGFAAGHGLPVRVVETREMEREDYRANRPDRCFHCKTELFGRLAEVAAAEGWKTIAYGAVTDDLGDVRPGMAAAGRHRVRAPLLEAGLGKLDVRHLAREAGLEVWDKPQSACLASRIPHGSEISPAKLDQVSRGEEWLRKTFGLRVVRLRHEGARARIEVRPHDIGRLLQEDSISAIRLELNVLGFDEVEIDPRGYRRPDPYPASPLQEVP